MDIRHVWRVGAFIVRETVSLGTTTLAPVICNAPSGLGAGIVVLLMRLMT